MKKLAILGFIISVSSLTSQTILADISTANSIPQNQKTHEYQSAWLGVWIEDIPLALGKHLSSQLKENQGVLITSISPESPAFNAGLQEFDVIAKFNDQEIFTREQLTRLVRSTEVKSTASLSIIRQGKLITQNVILEASPKAQMPPMNHTKPYGHFSPFSPHHRGMNNMPPWVKPFFNQAPGPNMHMPPPTNSQSSWSEFESIQIESTGNDKHRARVKHKDSKGNAKEFVFEGSREEIREQILKLEDMDKKTKQSLLQALDMNQKMPFSPFRQHHRMTPDWFNQPYPVPHGFNPQR